MKIDLRDFIAGLSLLAAIVSMIVVSRNARRATAVQMQNTDLARIRDLRAELRETKDELDHVKGQVSRVSEQLTEASEAARVAMVERAEMLRYARMPGMDLNLWLERFDTPQQLQRGRIDG